MDHSMDKYLGENDDTARFEALAMPHLDAAYNLARWLTRNEQDADDLVQNAYLRAFRFYASFRGDDARAWLLTIVRHTYYTALRDSRPERGDVHFDDELHDQCDDADPAHLAASRDTARSVNAALAHLSPALREVVVLKEMDDLSYKQIAQVTQTPIGTVMSRLSRARKQLLALLKPDPAGGQDGM